MNPAKILPVRREDSNEPYFSILYHRNSGRIVTSDYFSPPRRGKTDFLHFAQNPALIFCPQIKENTMHLVTCDDAADFSLFYNKKAASHSLQ